MDTVRMNTPCGPIIGISGDKCDEYRGIKYATAGRWEYPVLIEHWDGEYDATGYGECSYQRRAFEADEQCNAFYHKEFRKGLTFTYSEDCLYLNIWAPKDAHDCPVLIYIHGGSFTGGSGNEAHINGTKLAQMGVMVVSLNYRLGPYGFCSHPDITTDGKCGNYGMYDQYTAIKWVRDNIAALGGDPQRITLMGQSAGAMSVDILISSPLCRGWFRGAVMMSGAALQRAVARPEKPEKTRKFWDNIIANADVANMDELRRVDERTLFYAWSDACSSDKLSMLHTMPVVDGELITADSFTMRTIPAMPMMLGVTLTDMIPIALEILTKKYARTAIANGAQCYVYNFNRELPGDNAGAWHSCDLLYAFGSLEHNWRPFEDIDHTISEQMMDMLRAFVSKQDPNCDSIPRWDIGYKQPMRFCESTGTAPWDTSALFRNTFGNKGAEF